MRSIESKTQVEGEMRFPHQSSTGAENEKDSRDGNGPGAWHDTIALSLNSNDEEHGEGYESTEVGLGCKEESMHKSSLDDPISVSAENESTNSAPINSAPSYGYDALGHSSLSRWNSENHRLSDNPEQDTLDGDGSDPESGSSMRSSLTRGMSMSHGVLDETTLKADTQLAKTLGLRPWSKSEAPEAPPQPSRENSSLSDVQTESVTVSIPSRATARVDFLESSLDNHEKSGENKELTSDSGSQFPRSYGSGSTKSFLAPPDKEPDIQDQSFLEEPSSTTSMKQFQGLEHDKSVLLTKMQHEQQTNAYSVAESENLLSDAEAIEKSLLKRLLEVQSKLEEVRKRKSSPASKLVNSKLGPRHRRKSSVRVSASIVSDLANLTKGNETDPPKRILSISAFLADEGHKRLPIYSLQTPAAGFPPKAINMIEKSCGLPVISIGRPSGKIPGNEDEDSFINTRWNWSTMRCSESAYVIPVRISQQLAEPYTMFCDSVLWSLLHYDYSALSRDDVEKGWEAYKAVNLRFAEVVAEVYEDGDLIWIHDYQLLLLPALLQKRLWLAKIGLFLYAPFPSAEIFRILPQRNEILLGMVGADLVGFYTYAYAKQFLQSCFRLLGLEGSFKGVETGAPNHRLCEIGIYPAGIDVYDLRKFIKSTRVQRRIEELKRTYAGRQVIVSVDHAEDMFAGIPHKLLGFDRFLECHPEWIGKVVFVQVAMSSDGLLSSTSHSGNLDRAAHQKLRTGARNSDAISSINSGSYPGKTSSSVFGSSILFESKHPSPSSSMDGDPRDNLYSGMSLGNTAVIPAGSGSGTVVHTNTSMQGLWNQVYELVGLLNSQYGSLTFSPVHFVNSRVCAEDIVALMVVGHICILSSIRDGMRLLPMDWTVCQHEGNMGPLILSSFAGASHSFAQAKHVNPWDSEGMSEAIFECLHMSEKEKRLQDEAAYQFVSTHTARMWTSNFIEDLTAAEPAPIWQPPVPTADANLVFDMYSRATKHRLIILRYEGGLVSYQTIAQLASPSSHVLALLGRLSADPKNIVFVLSWRDRQTVSSWFGPLSSHGRIGLICEDGCFIKWPVIQSLTKQADELIMDEPLPSCYIETQDPMAEFLDENLSLASIDRVEDKPAKADRLSLTAPNVPVSAAGSTTSYQNGSRFDPESKELEYSNPDLERQPLQARLQNPDMSRVVHDEESDMGSVASGKFPDSSIALGDWESLIPGFPINRCQSFGSSWHYNDVVAHGDDSRLGKKHALTTGFLLPWERLQLGTDSPREALRANSTIPPLAISQSAHAVESKPGSQDKGLQTQFGSLASMNSESGFLSESRYSDLVAWKAPVLAVMRHFMERTPGSFVEEGETTITWHYQDTDTDYGKWQARDLHKHLENFMVRCCIVNDSIRRWIRASPMKADRNSVLQHIAAKVGPICDFLLMTGHDSIDNHIFEDMNRREKYGLAPHQLCTLFVGASSLTASAKFCVESVPGVVEVLKHLCESSGNEDLS